MTNPVLVLTDQPTERDEQVVETGLDEFNTVKAGYRDWRPVAALVRDPQTGQTLGGTIGRTSYDLLFIDLVYLPQSLRGHDVGSRLLCMIEDEGARRGCTSGVLTTITFQAPGFYERHGWQGFGRVACAPPGAARVFMAKTPMVFPVTNLDEA